MRTDPKTYTQDPEQSPLILGPKQLKARLLIGNTAFYDAIRNGALPAPSFYIGVKSPRWYWSDVAAHIQAQRGNGKSARAAA